MTQTSHPTVARPATLAYRLGEVWYTIEARQVLEVARFSPPTPIPGAPAGLLGLANFRGRIVPLLDVRSRLSAVSAVNPCTHTLYVEASGGVAGVAIEAMGDFSAEDVERPDAALVLDLSTLCNEILSMSGTQPACPVAVA